MLCPCVLLMLLLFAVAISSSIASLTLGTLVNILACSGPFLHVHSKMLSPTEKLLAGAVRFWSWANSTFARFLPKAVRELGLDPDLRLFLNAAMGSTHSIRLAWRNDKFNLASILKHRGGRLGNAVVRGEGCHT